MGLSSFTLEAAGHELLVSSLVRAGVAVVAILCRASELPWVPRHTLRSGEQSQQVAAFPQHCGSGSSIDTGRGWVGFPGSRDNMDHSECVCSYPQVPMCCKLAHTHFFKIPPWAAVVEGEILHLYVCVVQMVFLKIYFCVFIMFLNNVSIRAVRKICPCIFSSVSVFSSLGGARLLFPGVVAS